MHWALENVYRRLTIVWYNWEIVVESWFVGVIWLSMTFDVCGIILGRWNTKTHWKLDVDKKLLSPIILDENKSRLRANYEYYDKQISARTIFVKFGFKRVLVIVLDISYNTPEYSNWGKSVHWYIDSRFSNNMYIHDKKRLRKLTTSYHRSCLLRRSRIQSHCIFLTRTKQPL